MQPARSTDSPPPRCSLGGVRAAGRPFARPGRARARDGRSRYERERLPGAAFGVAVGSLALFARLLLGRRGVRRLAAERHATRRLQASADAESARLPERRRPRVLLSARCSMPFTFGVIRPVDRPPGRCGALAPGTRGAVLAHEMAHVLRRDIAVQSVRVRGLRALLVRAAAVAGLRRDAAGGRGVLRPAGDQPGIPCSGVRPGHRRAGPRTPGAHPAAGSHRRPGEAEHGAAAHRGHPVACGPDGSPSVSARRPEFSPCACAAWRRCWRSPALRSRCASDRTTRISERGSTRKTTGRCAWKHRRPL